MELQEKEEERDGKDIKKLFKRSPKKKVPINSRLMQKQFFRGVLRKSFSENMQEIYRRTPIAKRDSNKVALQLY